MTATIYFYDGKRLHVADDKATYIQRGIDAGGEWVNIEGNSYRVSDIRRIESNRAAKIKTVHELGLPHLDLPKELEAAYDKRTMHIGQIKLTEGNRG